MKNEIRIYWIENEEINEENNLFSYTFMFHLLNYKIKIF